MKNAVNATLNDLQLTIDPDTGGLLQLRYPGVGRMLDSEPGCAGMVDLACPVDPFEPLRLASRFSHDACVTTADNTVVIRWKSLGPSRAGLCDTSGVSAEVRLKAGEDRQSVLLSCELRNDSPNTIRQVRFPDLAGLLPFAGRRNTKFRTGLLSSSPFVELAMNEERLSTQYMHDEAHGVAQYKAGGMVSDHMLGRWTDFGGLRGGLSLFPKRWGWDPQVIVRLHLCEGKLRLSCTHDVCIPPGETWSSGEFCLTPHTGGWAKGIPAYRAWVMQNYTREHPLPKHVRSGLGFRTTWMCQCQPQDPQDAVFRFGDLPLLARECRDHGLDEMVVWAWSEFFALPIPSAYEHLGGERGLVEAASQCKEVGVNVSPFISVLQANRKNAPRYGVEVKDSNWRYHTDFVPRWNPSYADKFASATAPVDNKVWQSEVLESCKHLVDSGVHSLCWDQFCPRDIPEPNMRSLASAIRAYAKRRDPESVFSAENVFNIEIDSRYLDYTWNWGGYRDCRPFTSVFPAPRINCCISSSPAAVKKGFADNLYLNIFPRRPESVNGSDWIANFPELSKALKQCAGLRRQFLRFFTEGTMIGECLLAKELPGVHSTAYVLPEGVMMVLINERRSREITIHCEIASWLESRSGRYRVDRFSEEGERVGTFQVDGPEWQGKLGTLESNELTVLEFKPRSK